MNALPEWDVYEHRIAKLETDVEHLYSKTNGFAVASAEMTAQLDHVLVTLGELKESVKAVRERTGRLWDKLFYALLAALGTGLGAALLQTLR